MPYWLESDDFHSWPVWEVLADGVADVVDRLQAAYARCKSEASHIRKDGYLTAGTVRQLCRGKAKTVELLCTPVLEEKPLLHREGDDCECLGDSWIKGYDFRIHNFLKRNPSRRENDRHRQQKRDLADARLKGMVKRRDGACCRYCTSGPLSAKAGKARDRRKVLTFDHVDPDKAAGDDGANLVVACARCNEYKGKRTPYEADMVLLPAPTPEQAAALERRPQLLVDVPPAVGADHQPINDASPADHRIAAEITDHHQQPGVDLITDPTTDRKHDHTDDPTPQVHPSPVTPAPDQRSDAAAEGSGLGRGGPPDQIRPASPTSGQEPRTSEYPDVYHRRSRLPEPPPYIAPPEWPPPTWPDGAVPATPREDVE
ncbi:HNH endonuclease [Paractinoplanes atraurantiacus]|uniref:HNH endonuclease n=1 Tax=Paractinoplanes atraurantiacus TaxID=1036182 RepID=A0A285H0A1_9ACTN|nr:HNH endonuclease [Actinoplanes atraurantiacus]SNY28974.1 HNH endonuclease [Actinoplanes atraurantiacus]